MRLFLWEFDDIGNREFDENTKEKRVLCGGAAVTISQAVPFGAFAKDQSNLRAVELFAGIGGFRLACDSLGIHTIWANDINEKWAKAQQVRMNGLLQLYRSKGGSFGDEED